jgi:hypothetical protein
MGATLEASSQVAATRRVPHKLAQGASKLAFVVYDDAYADLLAATPPGWHVGGPTLHDERGEWVMYAFDPGEQPKVGQRSRQWTAVHPTEVGVVREMARCLQEIGAGRVPR